MKPGSYELTKEEKELLISGKERLKKDKEEGLGTKGDINNKETIINIIENGCWDKNPRPKYHDVYYDAKDYDPVNRVLTTKDGEKIKLTDEQTIHEYEDRKEIWTPAYTLSINHELYKYSSNESPLLTVRNIAVKDSISELFWIWIEGSNDLVCFDELLGLRPRFKDPITGNIGKQCKINNDLPGCRTWMSDSEIANYIKNHDLTKEELKKLKEEAQFINNWWFDWACRNKNGSLYLNEEGHPSIRQCYGYTASDQLFELRDAIKKDPDGRRHILTLWQLIDFKGPHGLKPCAFMTIWNVRHGRDGIDYLDCVLIQRSSDYLTAASINQYQYMVLQNILANDLNLAVGQFSWYNNNVQIYDRHIQQAFEQLNRKPIKLEEPITIEINKKKKLSKLCSKDLTDPKALSLKLLPTDITLKGYPRDEINRVNPQQRFQLGI